MLEVEQKEILIFYKAGCSIDVITEGTEISKEQCELFLKEIKKNQRKSSYTKEFTNMITERYLNGVTKTDIANELDITRATVLKILKGANLGKIEKQSGLIEVATANEMKKCPSCNSKKINDVTVELIGNEIYCMDCGEEHHLNKGKIYKVQWEHLE